LAVGMLALATGRRRLGNTLTLSGLLALYALSTPYVAGQMAAAVQSVPALPKGSALAPPPQAIVVLAAGLVPHAPEYGSAVADEMTSQRLAYAAYLWRQYKIPILVSGGSTPYADASLARVMEDGLTQVFGVPVTWVEDQSADTFENAEFSAGLLRADGIARILLVTHATHMPRAAKLFRATGLGVTPAPTAFISRARSFPDNVLPRQSALQNSYYAIYEFLGGAWYSLRGTYALQSP